MAEVCPFRGVRYNPNIIKDHSKVICAPSDILTLKKQKELYNLSPYNFVRLDACVADENDKHEDIKWQRAYETMQDWLNKDILLVDKEPALYVHNYYFNYLGNDYKRCGIIAKVRLEEWEKMVIRPHEKIIPELSKSRFSQIKHMKANTSPLMALYEDPEERISSLLSDEDLGKPIVSLHSDGEGTHDVWPITDSGLIKQICGILAEKPLYLADGHHRYTSALAFRDECRALNPSAPRDASFNFAMMTLTSVGSEINQRACATCSDSGVIIRPFHRVLRGVPESTVLNGLTDDLKVFFEVEEWSLNTPDVWDKADDLLTKTEPGKPGEAAIILYGLADKICILRICDFTTIDRAMPTSRSEVYKRLDVSIADHIIIEKLLKVDNSDREKVLGFCNDRTDALRKISEGRYQLAILLKAASVEHIIQVADAGETMPEKSTRFYPKVSTGFVFRQLV